jgi:hypothetical protein
MSLIIVYKLVVTLHGHGEVGVIIPYKFFQKINYVRNMCISKSILIFMTFYPPVPME